MAGGACLPSNDTKLCSEASVHMDHPIPRLSAYHLIADELSTDTNTLDERIGNLASTENTARLTDAIGVYED
jgi:hypothetical protein